MKKTKTKEISDNDKMAKEFYERGQIRFIRNGKIELVSFIRPEVRCRLAEYVYVYAKIKINCSELTSTEINAVAKQLCFKD